MNDKLYEATTEVLSIMDKLKVLQQLRTYRQLLKAIEKGDLTLIKKLRLKLMLNILETEEIHPKLKNKETLKIIFGKENKNGKR